LKPNLIPSKEECSKEEEGRLLVEFFGLLHEWHLEEQNKL